MNRSARARLAGVAVVGAVLSTGCGVAGTDFHPGVAAEVGDQTISSGAIDELVHDYCEYVQDNPAPEQPPAPRFGFRADLVNIKIQSAAVEQLAEEYDVEASATYDRQVADLRRELDAVPESQRDALLEINTSLLYLNEIQVALGQQLLAEEGQTEAAPEEAQARGQELLTEWLSTNEIEINPEYGLVVEDGAIAQSDQQLSVAVGERAQQSTATPPAESYTGALPAGQRCG